MAGVDRQSQQGMAVTGNTTYSDSVRLNMARDASCPGVKSLKLTNHLFHMFT